MAQAPEFTRPTGILRPERWNRTLFQALIDAAHERGGEPAIQDQERKPITRKRLLTAAFVLGRPLARMTEPGERVGVLLPNVTAIAATVFALLSTGRVPAMMNFTAGVRNLEAAAGIARMRIVLTSKRFVEQAKLEAVVAALSKTVKVVYLEDVREGLSLADKLGGALQARLPRLFYRAGRARPTDVAVILFTSGTERAPKAVALTHANILANIEQIIQSIAFTPADLMFNPLPVFHSFGLTGGFFLPILAGFNVFLYPSPLHYGEIPKLVRDSRATIVIGVDTFAAAWARSAAGDEFKTVRLMVLGAERVKDTTRQTWLDRFGTEILEGYGLTETAPVLAVNRPGQNRPGTVGPILPGVETRLEEVPGITMGKRLHVRGPNVMAGYIMADDPSRLLSPPGGWHDTGDIVSISADNYLTIRSRAKRFAKIGGEMISLAAIETLASSLWPGAAHVAVTIPDARKGEQIVLVTDGPEADRGELLAHAQAQGYPELWVPRAVLVTAAIPVLGSGKTDYVATRELALTMRPML